MWTPANIATALWLDAADAGTVQVVSGAISQWNDKSGNTRAAVQSTASYRPLLQANTLNGLPVAQFDGVDDFLPIPSWTTFPSPLSFVLVAIPLAKASGDRGTLVSKSSFYAITQSAFPASLRVSMNAATLTTHQDAGNDYTADITLSGAITPGAALIVGVQYSSTAGESIALWANGALLQSAAASGISTYSHAWTLGRESVEISGGVGGTALKGSIAEVVAVSGAITTDTRQHIEGYLAKKWGLLALLPADHPYKSGKTYTLAGHARFSDGAVASQAWCWRSDTGAVVGTVTPSPVDGAFAVEVYQPITAYITISKAGYRPKTHLCAAVEVV